jgi:hypothetical protein
LSDGTCLNGRSVKPTPDIPSQSPSLSPSFARLQPAEGSGSESQSPRRSACRCSRGTVAPLPQGSLAPVRVMLSRSILAYYGPMRRSRRHAAISLLAYTQRLRCAGAPRRPAGPSLLSLPLFPRMPSTRPRCSTAPSRCTHTAIPGFLEFLASRHPQIPSLPAIPDGVTDFGAASFSLCYGLRVCLALPAGYDKIKSRALHLAF